MARTSVRRLTLTVLLLAAAARAEAPLIPREVLFGNPERTRPQLAPDGKRLAWLQPDKGVLQVWVETLGKEDAAPVSADRQRPIRRFRWGQDSRTIVYLQDVKGDENWHAFSVDLASKQVRDLTPFDGVRAGIVADSPRRPNELLVEMNLQDRSRMDVYRVDLRTGAVVLDTRNPGTVTDWAATDDLVIKAGVASLPDGGEELLVRDSAKGAWRALTRVGPDDRLRAARPHRGRQERVLRDQRGRGDRARGPARAGRRSGEGPRLQHRGGPVRRLGPSDAARDRGRGLRAGAAGVDAARPDGEEGLRRLPARRARVPRGRLRATGPTGPGSSPSATPRARRGSSPSTGPRCRGRSSSADQPKLERRRSRR